MKLKMISLILLAAWVSGCATGRTKYDPYTSSGGYSEANVDEKIMVARFAGNAFTNKGDAAKLSNFRATEICYEKGYKALRIYDIKDLSSSQIVQKTSSYNSQQPTYFSGSGTANTNINTYGGSGFANTNSNFSGSTSGGGSQGGSTSWQETYHYPTFDTVFSCTNQAYMLKFKPKEISADDMKPFVKDLMGAVQVEEVMDGSPNKGILDNGDFIIKVNGSRVKNKAQMMSAIDSSKDKEKIALTVVRDGQVKTVSAIAIDGTSIIIQETEKLATQACTLPEVKKRPICAERMPAGH